MAKRDESEKRIVVDSHLCAGKNSAPRRPLVERSRLALQVNKKTPGEPGVCHAAFDTSAFACGAIAISHRPKSS